MQRGFIMRRFHVVHFIRFTWDNRISDVQYDESPVGPSLYQVIISKFFSLVVVQLRFRRRTVNETREEFPQNRIFSVFPGEPKKKKKHFTQKKITSSPTAVHSSSAQKWHPDPSHPARIFEFPTLPRVHRACVLQILACPSSVHV